jgi:hypothetical protein
MVGGILLLGLMAPVQFIAILKMRMDVSHGYKELAERHGMEMASALSLIAFAGYAFIPALIAKGDPGYFHEVMPFKPIYYFIKGILITNDPGLRYAFGCVQSAATFFIPALVYGGLNAKVASIIYTRMG